MFKVTQQSEKKRHKIQQILKEKMEREAQDVASLDQSKQVSTLRYEKIAMLCSQTLIECKRILYVQTRSSSLESIYQRT
jgi:hypothetical protein